MYDKHHAGIPIGYQLLSRELLFTTWVTAFVPYDREVVYRLPKLIRSDEIYYLQENYLKY